VCVCACVRACVGGCVGVCVCIYTYIYIHIYKREREKERECACVFTRYSTACRLMHCSASRCKPSVCVYVYVCAYAYMNTHPTQAVTTHYRNRHESIKATFRGSRASGLHPPEFFSVGL
jgi:hypothetical protein